MAADSDQLASHVYALLLAEKYFDAMENMSDGQVK
jgi:hypothetical protein